MIDIINIFLFNFNLIIYIYICTERVDRTVLIALNNNNIHTYLYINSIYFDLLIIIF